ncbi:hypothetical protein [Methanolobus sp.]|uniref:hypothetical protein n=1 Tax=Methanolobus sp. TaxID=1874737 RepID=UPI0025D77DEC|nr:hypothetical protein [Methanolobus sp.]
MFKRKYLVVLGILVLGLVVSGCTDNAPQETEAIPEDLAVVQELEDDNTSIADETLSDEMVGITDTEIQDIEEEVSELEEFINDTDSEDEIVVEEI